MAEMRALPAQLAIGPSGEAGLGEGKARQAKPHTWSEHTWTCIPRHSTSSS